MKLRLPLLFAAVLMLSACWKPLAKNATPTPTPTPEPKRNLSESLGFMPDASGYRDATPFDAQSPKPGAAAGFVPISRSLLSKDGRTLDAMLVSRTETTVTFHRKADGTEFTLPLDKLSDADQAFIRNAGLPMGAAR